MLYFGRSGFSLRLRQSRKAARLPVALILIDTDTQISTSKQAGMHKMLRWGHRTRTVHGRAAAGREGRLLDVDVGLDDLRPELAEGRDDVEGAGVLGILLRGDRGVQPED